MSLCFVLGFYSVQSNLLDYHWSFQHSPSVLDIQFRDIWNSGILATVYNHCSLKTCHCCHIPIVTYLYCSPFTFSFSPSPPGSRINYSLWEHHPLILSFCVSMVNPLHPKCISLGSKCQTYVPTAAMFPFLQVFDVLMTLTYVCFWHAKNFPSNQWYLLSVILGQISSSRMSPYAKCIGFLPVSYTHLTLPTKRIV